MITSIRRRKSTNQVAFGLARKRCEKRNLRNVKFFVKDAIKRKPIRRRWLYLFRTARKVGTQAGLVDVTLVQRRIGQQKKSTGHAAELQA